MDPHGASESQPPTPKTTYHSPTSHLSSLPPTPQTTFHSPTSHMSSLPPTPQTTYLSPTTHLSTQPPTPQTTYLSPTSRLSTLPPTPITTQDTQRPVELVSQRDNWQASQLGLVSRRQQQQDSQLGLVSRQRQQQQQDSPQRSVEDSQQDNWLDYQMQNEIKRKTYEICKQWLGITWIVFFVIAKASEIGIKILKNPTSAKCLRSIFCGLEVIHIYMVYKILRKGHEFPIKRRVQIFVMLVICGGFTAGIMFMIAVDSPFEKWGFIGPLVSGCVWFIPVLPLISDRVPVLPL